MKFYKLKKIIIAKEFLITIGGSELFPKQFDRDLPKKKIYPKKRINEFKESAMKMS